MATSMINGFMEILGALDQMKQSGLEQQEAPMFSQYMTNMAQGIQPQHPQAQMQYIQAQQPQQNNLLSNLGNMLGLGARPQPMQFANNRPIWRSKKFQDWDAKMQSEMAFERMKGEYLDPLEQQDYRQQELSFPLDQQVRQGTLRGQEQAYRQNEGLYPLQLESEQQKLGTNKLELQDRKNKLEWDLLNNTYPDKIKREKEKELAEIKSTEAQTGMYQAHAKYYEKGGMGFTKGDSFYAQVVADEQGIPVEDVSAVDVYNKKMEYKNQGIELKKVVDPDGIERWHKFDKQTKKDLGTPTEQGVKLDDAPQSAYDQMNNERNTYNVLTDMEKLMTGGGAGRMVGLAESVYMKSIGEKVGDMTVDEVNFKRKYDNLFTLIRAAHGSGQISTSDMKYLEGLRPSRLINDSVFIKVIGDMKAESAKKLSIQAQDLKDRNKIVPTSFSDITQSDVNEPNTPVLTPEQAKEELKRRGVIK